MTKGGDQTPSFVLVFIPIVYQLSFVILLYAKNPTKSTLCAKKSFTNSNYFYTFHLTRSFEMPTEYYISSTKYNLQERMTRRGKVYDVVFRIVTLDGIEKQKRLSGFYTKTLAKQAYTDFVTSKCELVKNNPIKKKAVEKKIPTVDELIPEYIASLFNQNKASSIYSKRHIYRMFVSPVLGSTPIDHLTKETLYQWQDKIWQMTNARNGKYYSYKYLSNVRALFGTFLSWCETRYGYKNHLQEVAKPKKRVQKTKMQVWSREQFEQFISSSLRHMRKTPFFKQKSGVFAMYYAVLWCVMLHFVTKICY